MGGGQAPERVLCIVPGEEPKEILDGLRSRHPGIEITYIPRQWGVRSLPQNLPDNIYKDKTILFTLSVLPDSREECPNVKLIQLFSAGADRVLNSPLFTDSTEIAFANCSGVHGPQISEWVVMTALILNHCYNPLRDAQKRHAWDRSTAFQVRDLVGQRLGVLGYGAIGRQVGRVAAAMGMDVIVHTATPKTTPEQKADHGYFVPGTGDPDGSIPSKWYSGTDKASLHNFLSQEMDILLVSVPLTPATQQMLSTAEFEIMGKHPPLVSNIARGPIIDTAALVTALRNGNVKAAALDVTDPEPLNEDSELWDMPNVVITPHVSGASTEYVKRAFAVLEANLYRMERGEKGFINEISRHKGY